MLLHYRTAVAALIQFIVVSLLSLVTGLDSVIGTCSTRHNNCVSNMLGTTLLFLLTAFVFGIIWVIGYAAQDRRSRRLAVLLIIIEAAVLLVAAFNASHHTSLLSLMASLTDASLAAWVIALAVRLIRANGGRIMASQRARQRPAHNPKIEL